MPSGSRVARHGTTPTDDDARTGTLGTLARSRVDLTTTTAAIADRITANLKPSDPYLLNSPAPTGSNSGSRPGNQSATRLVSGRRDGTGRPRRGGCPEGPREERRERLGLILRPHEVRFLCDACRRPVPSQSWCVSECFDRAGEKQHRSIRDLHSRRLRSRRPRSCSPPRSPHTRGLVWSCTTRESRVLHERRRPLIRQTGRRHPFRNRGEIRYGHTRQSLAGRTEQDPTNQRQAATTIAPRPRLPRAVSPSLSSVWSNASAGDQLHFLCR